MIAKFEAHLNAGEDGWSFIPETAVNSDFADPAQPSSANWKRNRIPEGIVVMKLQNTHLNMEPDEVFNIWGNIEKRLKWDERWINTDVLSHEGNEWVLYYMIPKPPIPFFSQRDNVCKFWIVENYKEGKKLLIATSVQH